MSTILIILGIVAVGTAVYLYFYKTGKINDRDGDYIPDEVEDTVDAKWKKYGLGKYPLPSRWKMTY